MAKLANAFFLLVTTLLVQLGGGKDLYWVHNTNWDNPSNWALGRVPCGGDNVVLPSKAVTFLNEDVTVGSIILPEDGLLILEPSVTIRFADDSECEVPATTEPMAADVKENKFLAPERYWECAENWLIEDKIPPEHSPCGEDNAIFKTGSAFCVTANESITVRSITVRGSTITSLKDDLNQKEFNLDIKVEPGCGKSPFLCPCPSDAGCPKVTPPTTQNTVGRSTNPLVTQNTAGIAVGVVFLVIVAIVAMVVFTVIIVVAYRRYKRTGGYAKDDLLEDPLGHEADDITHEGRSNPKGGSTKSSTFDNPVYDSHHLNDDEVQMIGYEAKLSDGDEQLFKPSLDEYQLPGETHKPQLDYDVDAEDVDQDEEKMPQYKYGKL